MRMIPARPGASSTGSELEVFDLLRLAELGEDSVAFAALNLAEHEYKKWGEIDFVVLCREGLVVIEVKGGLVSCDARGIWRYESRGRKPVERTESPIAQASSAYFSLRKNHLHPAVGVEAFRKAPSGFCTILAKTPRIVARGLIGGTEMPPALIGTSEDVRDPSAIVGFLERVFDYWRRRPPGATGKWDEAEVSSIGRALRPCFERIPPLSLSAARVRQEQLVLTEEQYAILDFAGRAPRVLCTGGAGCGKTLLAIECLRREMPNDPLLVTGTASLAAHLRMSAPAEASRILSFDELANGPPDVTRRYGSLIVDEGQQITDASSLRRLDELLQGGLEQGRWRWFSDPNNQVLSNAAFDPACQSTLQKLAFPGTLGHNCRNTPQIVSAVEVLTGADVGAGRMAGRGPDVQFAQGHSPEERIQSTAAIIRQWLKDPEIRAGEIVILSPRALDQSSAWEIARRAGVPIRAWEPGWDRHESYPGRMAAATIDSFRGLEAPFVVLCDMDVSTPDLQRWFYLGLTRANFAVAVAADPACVAALAQAVARCRSPS